MVQHTLRHGISTAFKSHKTLRLLLVQPKDERVVKDMAGVVYSTPCKDFALVYIGKAGSI